MLTYKNIKSIIAQFATNHPQIRNQHEGTPYDVDEIQQVDGIYLVWTIGGLNANGESGATWDMTIFIMSQVSEVNSTSNESSVKNDCSLVAMDFVSFLAKYNYGLFADDKDIDVEFQKNWRIDVFKERFNSLYSGAMLSSSIVGSFNYDRCNIPTVTPPETYYMITETGDLMITEDNNQMIKE